MTVRRFDPIALIERLDYLQRFAELSARVVEPQVLLCHAVDDDGYVRVVGDEHAVNRERPRRKVPELSQRVSGTRELSPFRIFAVLFGCLNQSCKHRRH